MIEKDLEQLGQNIARLRVAKRIKQSELAYEAGVSARTLQRIEAGEVVKTDGLLKVIRQLGRIDEFLSAVGTPSFSPSELARQLKNAKENTYANVSAHSYSDLDQRAGRRTRVRDSEKNEKGKKVVLSAPQKIVWPEDQK